MQTLHPDDFEVRTLGPATRPSPLALSTVRGDEIADYVPDDTRVLYEVEVDGTRSIGPGLAFEKAGPRAMIHFDPAQTTAAIVTCGGLCPGIDNVVRSLVLELHHKYGVRRILGLRYGYSGSVPGESEPPLELAPRDVADIHHHGGSMLGVSRGAPTVARMVDGLETHGVQILFTIGGDGTQRGAHAIADEASRRGLSIAVVGIPKTVDNDVPYVDRTFGFDTAVEVARLAVDAAHAEARSTLDGIGVVKLMGRDAGFVAAAATLASREANFCLIPEVAFDLHGPHGLLVALEHRLADRRHAVIVAAEGCAGKQADAGSTKDASGNVRYADAKLDFGPKLCDAIREHFAALEKPIGLKYIDPSYMIRSVPANASDSIFCDALARHAAHAAMAGKTDLLIGRAHGIFTHVPLAMATRSAKRVDPDGALWLAVTEATGQPRLRG